MDAPPTESDSSVGMPPVAEMRGYLCSHETLRSEPLCLKRRGWPSAEREEREEGGERVRGERDFCGALSPSSVCIVEACVSEKPSCASVCVRLFERRAASFISARWVSVCRSDALLPVGEWTPCG